MTATRLPGAILATNFDSAVRRNVMSSLAAALLSTRMRDVDRFGGARHAQDLALDSVFADLERLGTEVGHRFAFAIDRADEHHAFAGGLGRVGCR